MVLRQPLASLLNWQTIHEEIQFTTSASLLWLLFWDRWLLAVLILYCKNTDSSTTIVRSVNDSLKTHFLEENGTNDAQIIIISSWVWNCSLKKGSPSNNIRWWSSCLKTVCIPHRPVLSQVKQKTPIILPGFQVVGVPDELSGQSLVSWIHLQFFVLSAFIVVIQSVCRLCDQSESSQLETKLSGLPVSSVGKRDSMLARAELNDKSTTKPSNSVSVSPVVLLFFLLT